MWYISIKNELSCIYYNFENKTSSNNDLKCCMIFNNKNKLCYLVTEKIKENKTTFNNEEYLIKCKNESEYENKSNDKLELVLGEFCVTNKSINIT